MTRDAHGRASRADGAPRRRPVDGFRVRDRERFAELVNLALAQLPGPLRDPVRDAVVRVEDVPPAPPGGDVVPLARYERAPGGDACLTLYRRPLELRAFDRSDLTDLIRLAAGRAVAEALGLDEPEDPWG